MGIKVNQGVFMRSVVMAMVLVDSLALIAAQPSARAKTEEWATLIGHTGPVFAVEFAPKGHVLATGSFDGTVRIWNASSGKQEKSLSGHMGRVHSLSFNKDGTMLCVGAGTVPEQPGGACAGEISLWEVGTWKQLRQIKYDGGAIMSVAFLPSGKSLISASTDKSVTAWDGATLQATGVLERHPGVPYRVVASADGALIASGAGQTPVRVSHLIGEKRTQEVAQPNASAIAMSHDARVLAIGTVSSRMPGEVVLWDVVRNSSKTVFKGFHAGVFSVTFSANGDMLACGSGVWDPKEPNKTSGEIKIYDVESGKELESFYGHADAVMAVAFSPDSKVLASGSQDGTAKLWRVRNRPK
jgi:WD40 repeat protein